MFPHGEGRTTKARVEHALQMVKLVAFEQGRVYALTSLLTSKDLAELFGVTERRVRAIAQAKHEQFGIGYKTPRGDWLFAPEEIESLRPGSPGRPIQHGQE